MSYLVTKKVGEKAEDLVVALGRTLIRIFSFSFIILIQLLYNSSSSLGE